MRRSQASSQASATCSDAGQVPRTYCHSLLLRRLQGHLQEFFPLAPVHRQDPVARHVPYRLRVLVVHAVDAVFLFGRRGAQDAFAHQHLPQFLAQARIVADGLGNDVPRSGQCALRIRHFFFRVDIPCGFLRRNPPRLLQHQPHCQRLQPAFLCNGRAGPALRPVRAVQVLQLTGRLRLCELLRQIFRQHTLLCQALLDLFPALVQVPQILQPFGHFPEHLVVQRSGHFLPVSCDKGNRVSGIQQFHCRLHLSRTEAELRCQLFDMIHRNHLNN